MAEEKGLIDDVLRPQLWATATDDQLHDLVGRLAPLMRFRQRRQPVAKRRESEAAQARMKAEAETELRARQAAAQAG